MDVLRWDRFVALGDSFTEGMCDPVGAAAPPGGGPVVAEQGFRGWADRLAERMGPEVAYANLAVRGRLLQRVLDEQLPPVLELLGTVQDAGPAAGREGRTLVSLVAGGNDCLRPGSDVDAMARSLEDAVGSLRAAGADVLLATAFDPAGAPVVSWSRGRSATWTSMVWSVARRQHAHVLDVWGLRALHDARMWSPDRVHLTAEGHRRVAELAAATLGVPRPDAAGAGAAGTSGAVPAELPEWAVPLPPAAARRRSERLAEDWRWAGAYLAPWVVRRLRRRSSGDGRSPKRPLDVPQRVEG